MEKEVEAGQGGSSRDLTYLRFTDLTPSQLDVRLYCRMYCSDTNRTANSVEGEKKECERDDHFAEQVSSRQNDRRLHKTTRAAASGH